MTIPLWLFWLWVALSVPTAVVAVYAVAAFCSLLKHGLWQ